MNIRDRIIEKFNNGDLTFKDERRICAVLNVHPAERKYIVKILKDLEKDGIIMSDGNGGYGTPEQLGAFVARVQGHERGFAFLIPEDPKGHPKDYFVPRKSLNGAMNRDRVLAFHKRGTQDEAVVVRVLERGQVRVVGTFEKDKRAGYVIVDDKRFDSDVFVPLYLCGNAKPGDKVVAEITNYPRDRMVGGKIIEILGESGDFYAEELAIIRSYDLIEEFPEPVLKQAEDVAKEEVVLGGREDFRELLTITIDGEDTRDIDDAISLSKEGENYVLGVHIADVSHYVQFGSKLDREAYERGTSVYFPDTVLPMLPHSLSNGACSLNEGEDRYAMSAVMTFDKNGTKLKTEFYESLINSNHRMTYNQVTAMLDGDADLNEKYADVAPMIRDMQELCLLLEDKRKRSGSVSLDVKEAHIYVNEQDEIVIPDYERSVSHRMIEQFMVSANESVAERIAELKLPFLYRIHEKPSPEKASTFFSFLRDLGVKASANSENVTPKDYQAVLDKVQDMPYASVVNRVMLRSMQKARYSETNAGHFGLASECYCHFTSPIRRYPDLFVHRVLKRVLWHDEEGAIRAYSPIAHQAGIDTSEKERIAERAERDVDDLYKVVYMSERIGEEYDAVISGVTDFGIFCELANTIEGIIPIEVLPKDGYEFFEDKYLLKGAKHSFKIGQEVRIRVAGCNYSDMRVEFVLADK